jgi:hypothetical protein
VAKGKRALVKCGSNGQSGFLEYDCKGESGLYSPAYAGGNRFGNRNHFKAARKRLGSSPCALRSFLSALCG